MRRLIFPLLLGVLGVAILVGLGVWQVQRLAWKEGVLAQIEARIGDAPVTLPAAPTEAGDEYRAVTVEGVLLPRSVLVLVSAEDRGAGYRVIQPLAVADRTILVDLGFLELEAEGMARAEGPLNVTGNLLWPDEVDSWTPEPDAVRNIWFARDLPAMAAALGAEPVLVVARMLVGTETGTDPLPIDTAAIPNDHLNYAITWFLLALVWAAMSGLLVRRTRQRKD